MAVFATVGSVQEGGTLLRKLQAETQRRNPGGHLQKHNEDFKKNSKEGDDGLAVLGTPLEEEIHVIVCSARLCAIFPRNAYLRKK